MDSHTITMVAIFLAPFLQKAGEKVTEEMVEKLLSSRREIAEKFTGLFYTEFQQLGLSNSDETETIVKRLDTRPEIKEEIRKKVVNNLDLLNELISAFEQMSNSEFNGITINSKNIGQVINNPTAPIYQNNNFN